MFFTLIIPAYNCQETIDRLLISVVNQHYSDLKVIVIDDSDKDRLCQSYINKYKEKLNIEYYIRRDDLYTCHCPGNTRHDGLRRALEENTEYIFFADCDDEFFPDCLTGIYDFLKENKYPEAILTPFWSYNEDTNKELEEKTSNDSWLHGKFYKKSFLKDNDIQFKIDLFSHEDVYFNVLLKACLIGHEKQFLFYNKKFYKWYIRKTSISHTLSKKNEKYFELHFKDWLDAVIIPLEIYFNKFPNCQHFYINQIAINLVLGYLYIQGFLYYNYDTNILLLKENYKYYKQTLINIMSNFGLTKQEIIVMGYNHPDIFNINRQHAISTIGHFMEEQSFKDFINDIHIYE